MALRRKFETLAVDQDDSVYELDLSPMLALMVTLIPIMLLATVFVKITIVETALPQVVQQAIEEDRNKKERDVSIHLNMNGNKEFSISVLIDSKKSKTLSVASKSGEWDLEGLHGQFVALKQQFPRVFRVDLFPSEGVLYQDIVKVMDEARNTKSGDPTLYLLDKETNKKIETNVMFPDVIFSNVVGG